MTAEVNWYKKKSIGTAKVYCDIDIDIRIQHLDTPGKPNAVPLSRCRKIYLSNFLVKRRLSILVWLSPHPILLEPHLFLNLLIFHNADASVCCQIDRTPGKLSRSVFLLPFRFVKNRVCVLCQQIGRRLRRIGWQIFCCVTEIQ